MRFYLCQIYGLDINAILIEISKQKTQTESSCCPEVSGGGFSICINGSTNINRDPELPELIGAGGGFYRRYEY